MEIMNLLMGHLTWSWLQTLSISAEWKGTEKTIGAVSVTSQEKEMYL